EAPSRATPISLLFSFSPCSRRGSYKRLTGILLLFGCQQEGPLLVSALSLDKEGCLRICGKVSWKCQITVIFWSQSGPGKIGGRTDFLLCWLDYSLAPMP